MTSLVSSGFSKKNRFLELISLGTPASIVMLLSGVFFLASIVPPTSIKYSPFRCLFRYYIFPIIFRGHCPTSGFFEDCKCLGCGLTRAFVSLMHGDVQAAINFNKHVLLVVALMIALIAWNYTKLLRNSSSQK
uniref:DUF2752 domain-containing protein n=1 Tax=candidate division WWE3 bacterium TaxID=2053526 RepID=A0A7C4TQ33_UNCKA